ncbi:MAG: HlyC/CorC family transporter [Planctomycetota bacterium]|nr:MAG: HlyC/CorC family transporter [Planctomycetota bacterium]REJ93514.1 MAG: HlyC/CorC family transporter [Planctomycetota bacterium]
MTTKVRDRCGVPIPAELMMTWIALSILLVLAIWGICSLVEGAVYAVRLTYIRGLMESGSRSGQLLSRFKENIEHPISAILIVNTAACAAGSAIVGAQVSSAFGEGALIWFSACFTLVALFCSEIIPKVLGVTYNRSVSRIAAVPLHAVILALYPLIWFIERVSRFIKPGQPVLTAPEEEVKQMAMISAEEGSIMPYEADLVRNVLRLDNTATREIMTPRPVVLKLPADMTVRSAQEHVEEGKYSRIPIFAPQDPETWVGFVLSRDVLTTLAKDKFDEPLESLRKPMYFVSEKTRGHVLLRAFLKRRTHLFGVVDEYGDVTGIVTLEDVLESLIGEEIVDELDAAVDMQEVARLRKRERFGKSDKR